ncbi:hypothetical protein AAON49_09505 [Pseudotenacibaculum sp. MALMAid0570]|uniref:hypothetical protein n=1 Tax=Pseudotenacibaculum sp. MALMAid0570 TaxID=3143938 RepID=UPI0032DEDD1B
MFKKLEITCDEATTICDKNQYGESTLWEKIKLNIHFLKCRICALYTKQNTTLTKIYKKKAKEDQVKTTTRCMSNEEKEKLRKELEKLSV